MTTEMRNGSPASIDRDYRRSHVSREAAHRYEALYKTGTYEDWVWALEKAYVAGAVRKHVLSRRPEAKFLDFACGTGRILTFLEPMMAEVTGVDVSVAMLNLTRDRVSKARLICTDITKHDVLPAGGFDLITAFRFFLNADLSLRQEALKAIRRTLADDGILIANIHGNRWSMHLIPFLVRRYFLRQGINATSIHEMRRLLAGHGFEVIQVSGQAWCTRRVYELLGRHLCDRIEAIFSRVSILSYLRVNLIFVCRPVGCC